jgi:hypothetical protein
VRWPLLLVVLAACGGKKPSGDGWTERPTEPTSRESGELTVTVELPDGLVLTTDNGYDLQWTGVELGDPRGYVLVGSGPVSLTLERALDDLGMIETEAKILRKRAIDGGYLITQTSQTFVRTTGWTELGGLNVTCDSALAAAGDVERAADWTEKVCLSVKITGAPAADGGPALDGLSTDQLGDLVNAGAFEGSTRIYSLAERYRAAKLLAVRLGLPADTPVEQVVDHFLGTPPSPSE